MRIFLLIATGMLAACNLQVPTSNEGMDTTRTTKVDTLLHVDTLAAYNDSARSDGTAVGDTGFIPPARLVDTKSVAPASIVAFAKTLIGTPYVYGSTNPKVGFDCSGFITYVFNHFGIAVPRSSVDFTRVGTGVDTLAALPGDLILFTGTNPAERHVGHMGIVVGRENGTLQFIHSTSGKQMGVTITPLSDYYKSRFVRVARVFP